MLTIATRHPRGMQAKHVNLFTALLFLVTIVVFSSAAQAAIIFQYETMLELDLGAAGRALPTHVTCEPVSGEVCVTDVRQSTFHVLNARHVQLLRTGAFAGVSWPSSGCLQRDGTLVFTDTADGRHHAIRRLDIFGEPAAFTPEAPAADWSPRLLTVLANGDYLSLDPGNGLLARHRSDSGALVWSLRVGDPAARDSQFGRPAEGPDGRLYIPGGDQRKVYVVTADGLGAGEFGRFGSAPGRMVLPVGVGFGPGGTVLVLDRMRAKILVFGADLEFQSEFGSLGARPGQFYHPADITSTADHRIYVAQGFQGRVQVFRVIDSQESAAEKTARSNAALVVDRIALGGTPGPDRAAMRSPGLRTDGSAFEPLVAVATAADRSLNLEAEQ